MRLSIATAFVIMALALANAVGDELPPPAPTGGGVLFGHAVFSNGSSIANAPLVILARSNDSETVYRLITDSAGRFVLSLSATQYSLDSLLDYPETPGMDFASTASADLATEGNATLIFYPAGSLAGTVTEAGSPVPGARVRVNCPSSSFDYARINGGTAVQSGDAGDFLFSALPVGTCVVSASTDSLAGSQELQVENGMTSSASVALLKKAAQTDALPIALAVLVAAIIAYAAFQFLQKGKKEKEQTIHAEPSWQSSHFTQKKKEAKQKEEEEEGISSKLSDPKVKAVLATLTEREREITRFIFKAGGRAKRSTIQHKLLIPKTSLLRNLRSLERKKIVKLTPFGRNLLAEIEDWLHK